MYDIRFPHLGITFHNLKDGFTIFGFEIKFYGLIIGIGFLLAYFLVISEAKRTKQDTEIYLDFFLWLVIPAILGARLYYIIFNAGEYFEKGKGFGQTIKDLINIRNGGLAIYGGIIAGVITAIIFCRKKKVKFLVLADTISIGLLLGQIIGRWGNFFNSEAYGAPTNLPWKLYIAPQYRKIPYLNEEFYHPAFLYESILDIIIFLILVFLVKTNRIKFDGFLAALYLILYSTARILVEIIRIDSVRYLFGMPIAIIMSIGIIILSTLFLIKSNKE